MIFLLQNKPCKFYATISVLKNTTTLNVSNTRALNYLFNIPCNEECRNNVQNANMRTNIVGYPRLINILNIT